MENHLYTCHYCGIKYKPNRRNKQLYCSNSCRVNSFNIKKKEALQNNKKGLAIPKQKNESVQKINIAGIGNAAIANVATEFAKNIFTKEENKPATKGDLQGMLSKIQLRYMPISNMPNRVDGAKPFYDSGTETVVFRNQLPTLKLG